jgi:hypothetical protein
MSIDSGNLLCNIDIYVAVVLKVPKAGGDKFLSFFSAALEVMVSALLQILQARCSAFYCSSITAIPFDFGTSSDSSLEVITTEVLQLLKI